MQTAEEAPGQIMGPLTSVLLRTDLAQSLHLSALPIVGSAPPITVQAHIASQLKSLEIRSPGCCWLAGAGAS